MDKIAKGPTPEEDAAEEELRRVANLIIALCLLFLILFAVPFLYAELRPLLGTPAPSSARNAPPTFALPAMPAWLAIGFRAGALVCYGLAIRIVLRVRPPGGKGLIIAFAVAFFVMGAVLGLLF